MRLRIDGPTACHAASFRSSAMARSRSCLHPAADLLAQYAEYHRDQRNIATHQVGVPLIVFALGVLLARPTLALDAGLAWALTPAWCVWVVVSLWYLTRGEPLLGFTVSAGMAALIALGQPLAAASLGTWLGLGLGCFTLGWLIQFVGHYYEGRRPPLVGDLIGLLVGPMFVTAEALFALGWKPGLQAAIERRAGPVVLHDLAARA
jgi:uncharacterized membrane protein YGL010W